MTRWQSMSAARPCRPKGRLSYRMCGMPTPPWRILYSLLSYNSCGCLAFWDSNFTATSWNDTSESGCSDDRYVSWVAPSYTPGPSLIAPISHPFGVRNTADFTGRLPLRSWCWSPGKCRRRILIRSSERACIFRRLWIRLWSRYCSPCRRRRE